MTKTQRLITGVDRLTAWVGSVSSLVAHTGVFALAFVLALAGVLAWDTMFLILTTLVSLEAIYLAIFIQMTVNRNTVSLEEVESDIDEIQEDVEGLEKDVDEIQEDIEEMSEDVEEMQEDLGEMQEDLEEISADEEPEAGQEPATPSRTLEEVATDLRRLLDEIDALKGGT
jgi:uncharacterized membrane protein